MLPDDGGPGTLVGIGTAIGVLVARMLPKLMRTSVSEAAQIRKELRDQVLRLEKKIDSLEGEVDHWREKFYQVNQDNLELRLKVKILTDQVETMQRSGAAALGSSPPRP